jgi:hypothetical protein
MWDGSGVAGRFRVVGRRGLIAQKRYIRDHWEVGERARSSWCIYGVVRECGSGDADACFDGLADGEVWGFGICSTEAT